MTIAREMYGRSNDMHIVRAEPNCLPLYSMRFVNVCQMSCTSGPFSSTCHSRGSKMAVRFKQWRSTGSVNQTLRG